MFKYHLRNGASCLFQKLKNTSEKKAQNGAVSVIDFSRASIKIIAPFLTTASVDTPI
jgi:hypothetical protein